jgi:hypothetical protein
MINDSTGMEKLKGTWVATTLQKILPSTHLNPTAY